MKTIILLFLIIVFRHWLLNIISGILYGILNPINSFVVAWKYRYKNGFLKQWSIYNLDSARNLDKYANNNFRSLWNFLFQRNGYKFGSLDETISYVLGANQYQKTLTYLGWFVVIVLWIIDISNWIYWDLLFKWKPQLKFKKGHCLETYLNE